MRDEKTRLRAAGTWFLRATGGDDTELLPVSDGFTVGRSDDCDLVLSEGFASRKHATFSVQGLKLVVEDRGSSNGTFVNDRRIERQALNAGDRVRFDTCEYEVVLNDPEPADEDATIVRPEPVAPASGESGVAEPAAAFAVEDAQSAPEHEVEREQSGPEAETMLVAGATEVSGTAETTIDDRRVTAVENSVAEDAETAVWQAPDIGEAESSISAEAATAVMPPPPREVILTGLGDPVAGRNYTLAKERMTVGRSPLNDIILRSDSVSSQHAEIQRESGKWVLRDRGSSNGTYVNGEAVSEWALEPGDIVTFGAVELEFDAAGRPETDTDAADWVPTVESGISRAIKLFAIAAIVAAAALAAFIFIRGPGIGAP